MQENFKISLEEGVEINSTERKFYMHISASHHRSPLTYVNKPIKTRSIFNVLCENKHQPVYIVRAYACTCGGNQWNGSRLTPPRSRGEPRRWPQGNVPIGSHIYHYSRPQIVIRDVHVHAHSSRNTLDNARYLANRLLIRIHVADWLAGSVR